ncbi:hypothetical protein B4U79_13545 [Dinothrombium tinctorium]|uniref:Ig-like domain-containing protein n=1 Tax=Dinothrombium tinctorium TaxID=1965070 RepID=A0A3S3S332_9ACAR|nr:hypothetical protein B4U79_04504 [Dinothrombium tinctorium]RWS08446.1 hypothetical protein B4U79_13545 [Dinothrombium tinctorium]
MKITVSEGESVSLPCKVRDLAPYILVWRRDKDKFILYAGDFKITKDPRFKLVETMNALIIDGVKSEDVSNYTCQVGTNPPREITHQLSIIGSNPSNGPIIEVVPQNSKEEPAPSGVTQGVVMENKTETVDQTTQKPEGTNATSGLIENKFLLCLLFFAYKTYLKIFKELIQEN